MSPSHWSRSGPLIHWDHLFESRLGYGSMLTFVYGLTPRQRIHNKCGEFVFMVYVMTLSVAQTI
jgi:hypothetical protein